VHSRHNKSFRAAAVHPYPRCTYSRAPPLPRWPCTTPFRSASPSEFLEAPACETIRPACNAISEEGSTFHTIL
jgi:hypothetical protein